MNRFTNSSVRRWTIIIAALSLVFSFALAGMNLSVLQAQTNSIVVTSLNDSAPGDSVQGVCPDAANCTLRAALEKADQSTTPTTITFSVSGLISLKNSLIVGPVSGTNVTIDGSGQTVVLDGGGQWEVFFAESPYIYLTLNHLVIQNGGGRGAIHVNGSTVTLSNSQVINNHRNGLRNFMGNVLIVNSLFTGNNASTGAAVTSDLGHMTIANSTLVGNHASGYGGGLDTTPQTTIVISSVIAQNTGNGAPDVFGPIISLGHNLIGATDGSSFSPAYSGTATALQSMYATNAGTAVRSIPVYPPPATITPTGFVASATATSVPVMQNNGSDRLGTSAAPLDPLLDIQLPTDNTGATVTVRSGSPLLGNGLCAGYRSVYPAVPAITTDLKGNPRGTPCTIGAYEQ